MATSHGVMVVYTLKDLGMTFKDYFSQQAADYATYRPRYPDPLFRWLADQCNHQELAWDCATGNGQAAIALTHYFQQVIATDGSGDQLSQAPAHPQVTYRLALAEDSGLADHTVDLVTVAQAVHWFNLEAFYREVERVLKPGGRLAIWCYGVPSLATETLNRTLDAYYRTTLAPFWPPERHLVEAGYRTLAFPWPEVAAPPLTMQVLWTLPQLLGYLFTWSGTQAFIRSRGYNPLESLAAVLAQDWGGDRQLLTWPIHLRCGHIHP